MTPKPLRPPRFEVFEPPPKPAPPARIQILELPSEDDEHGVLRTPFAVIIDQADEMMTLWADRHQDEIAKAFGARGVFAFSSRVQVPGGLDDTVLYEERAAVEEPTDPALQLRCGSCSQHEIIEVLRREITNRVQEITALRAKAADASGLADRLLESGSSTRRKLDDARAENKRLTRQLAESAGWAYESVTSKGGPGRGWTAVLSDDLGVLLGHVGKGSPPYVVEVAERVNRSMNEQAESKS